MSKTLTVGDYMSDLRVTVTPEDSVRYARDLVQLHGVRHLPVIENGIAVGVLTVSDLYVLEASIGLDPDRALIREFMTEHPVTASRNDPLIGVAQTMNERRIGSVVIHEDGKAIGLFTASDAISALADVLAVLGQKA